MPAVGSRKMIMYADKYLLVGGSIREDVYHNTLQIGALMIFDKTDTSTVLTSSPKFFPGSRDTNKF